MWMMKRVRVRLDERVVTFRDGLPYRALGPGRHWVWHGLGRLTEQRFDTSRLVFDAWPEVRAAMPGDWFREVSLAAHERAVVFRDGRPVAFLRPGLHRVWTVEPSVRVETYSVLEPMPALTDELMAVIPRHEVSDVIVAEHERALRYVQGRLVSVLGPGRYTEWTHPAATVAIERVDVRRKQLALAGQELMTRDKVTLRLSLTVEYALADPVKAATSVAKIDEAVYLATQLAARDYVAGVTLDELLEGRDAMTRHLEATVVPKASAVGVRVDQIGVKDVVLPGEMKTLLNRVIEAEKEAAAQVILRREEAQATRSLANTARVLAEHPVLLRLKELEAMKDIASRIHEVRVVVGQDGLDKLLTTKLLLPER